MLKRVILKSSLTILLVFLIIAIVIMVPLFLPDKYASIIKNLEIKSGGNIDYIYNNADSLDLIGFKYKGLPAWYVKFFTGSFWSHVGVIYVDKKSNKKYVLEIISRNARDLKVHHKKNVTLRPLKEWLIYHQNHQTPVVFVKRKMKTTKQQTKKLKSLILYYKDAKMLIHPYLWRSTLVAKNKRPKYKKTITTTTPTMTLPLPLPQLRNPQDSFFCSDFASYILQLCGVFDDSTKEPVYVSNYNTPGELLFEYPSIYQKPIIVK